MPDEPAAPTEVHLMSPEQAGARLAEIGRAYQAAQVSPDSVPPPPPGVPATTPAQAAARLAQLRADPAWRRKVLTGSAVQQREFAELTEMMASGGVQSDNLIETVDAISGDPNTLRRSHYEGLMDGLRESGMNDIAEDYVRQLDAGNPNYLRGTEGDKAAFRQALDRLMKSPEMRTKYLAGDVKLTNVVNGMLRVIALADDDGRPLSDEGKEILTRLGLR